MSQVRIDGGCRWAGIPPDGDASILGFPDPSRTPQELLDFIRRNGRPFDWQLGQLGPAGHLSPAESCLAQWNSVMLFHNLASALPSDYSPTTVQDAREFIDEGLNPANPTISDFMRRYWCALSLGKLAFGIDTPRDATGQPLIPTISPVNGYSDWGDAIRLCIAANHEAVWRAAGSLYRNGHRWIPSVVLVQRYDTGLHAFFDACEVTCDGILYEIGDRQHTHYVLQPPRQGPASCRMIWGRMCHEYAHNFLGFGDLYGYSGCTGYWDLHGDNSTAGCMSEVCSYIKERAGWIQWKAVIEGPSVADTEVRLLPYTTTGEAVKIVPDPQHNPHEFFMLEYRKSTGSEPWRPDGALTEEGLLIAHVNTRMLRDGASPQEAGGLLREAPFYDPEFADNSDHGGALWTGMDRLTGVLYPQPGNNSFTPTSRPASHFYGRRPSGLHVTDIAVSAGELRCRVRIDGNPQVGWTLSSQDRGLVGRFFDEPLGGPEQVVLRNGEALAVLVERQAQWLVAAPQQSWIGEWNLEPDDYAVVGDFDGDGLDEIYLRNANRAGVIDWRGRGFRLVTLQYDSALAWDPSGESNHAADLDGDGIDEILTRSPNRLIVLKLIDGHLRLLWSAFGWIDQWDLNRADRQYVGRFTQRQRHEVVSVRSASPMSVALLEWDPAQTRIRLRRIEHGWVDQWHLDSGDRLFVGDFDGDGLDEIFIRSANRAALLKWHEDRFALQWMDDTLTALDGQQGEVVLLGAGDECHVGAFFGSRAGILHRSSLLQPALAILRGDGIRVGLHRFATPPGLVSRSPLGGRWPLATSDRFLLGVFTRGGPDLGSPSQVVVGPNQTGVFMHNGFRTGKMGTNYFVNHDGNQINAFQLSWIGHAELMLAPPPSTAELPPSRGPRQSQALS